MGIEFTRGDPEVVAAAIADEINENGGVLGRQIEVAHTYYLPIGTEEALASCLELTEDEDVFAVISGYGGAGGVEEANLCITGQNDTILVGRDFSADELAQATAPWITDEAASDRRLGTLVDALDQDGRLDELGPVAVHSDAENKAMVDELLVPALEDAEAEIEERTVLDVGFADFDAAAEQWSIFLERYRAAGIEDVFMVGDTQVGPQELAASDLGATVYMDDVVRAQSGAEGLEDTSGITIISLQFGYVEETSEGMQACYDNLAERTGVEVVQSADVPEGEDD